MLTLSTLSQDRASKRAISFTEWHDEEIVARQIIREGLAKLGYDPDWADNIEIQEGPKLTATLGWAKTKNLDRSKPIKGVIRLSTSPLWRRASPQERRDTVLHELAHIIADWESGRGASHGPNWVSVMVRMGQRPDRCHRVPAIRKKRKAARVTRRRAMSTSTTPFCVGDLVIFGDANPLHKLGLTAGNVVKVNRKTLKIEAREPRGKAPVGAIWTASRTLCKKVV